MAPLPSSTIEPEGVASATLPACTRFDSVMDPPAVTS